MAQFTSFLPAFIALFLFASVHLAVWRTYSKKSVFLLLAIAVAAFVIAVIITFLFEINPVSLKISLTFYALSILAYLHFYIGIFRSVSVRILEELKSAGGHMTLEDLESSYPKKWMLGSRLELLSCHGWLEKSYDGTLRCTRKGTFFARVIVALRKLYGIKKAG